MYEMPYVRNAYFRCGPQGSSVDVHWLHIFLWKSRFCIYICVKFTRLADKGIYTYEYPRPMGLNGLRDIQIWRKGPDGPSDREGDRTVQGQIGVPGRVPQYGWGRHYGNQARSDGWYWTWYAFIEHRIVLIENWDGSLSTESASIHLQEDQDCYDAIELMMNLEEAYYWMSKYIW